MIWLFLIPLILRKNDLKYLESDISKFEPNLALDGGLDGLSVIRKVIKKTSELFKKKWKIYFRDWF